jgi:hypothetical protein
VGSLDARVEDLALVFVGPPMVANTGTGEVDDDIRAHETRDIHGAARGIPPHFVGALSVPANEPDDLVPLSTEVANKGPTDETRSPRDRVAHVD